jgi:signal transduction histidine kinase
VRYVIRLVLRLALWIAAVVIASFITLGSLISPANDGDHWLLELLSNAGLAELAAEVEAAPPDQRDAVIHAHPGAVALGAHVVNTQAARQTHFPPRVELSIPLDDGATALALRPVRPPMPDQPTLALALAAVVVVVFSAAVAVAFPLARRLAAIEGAMAALQAGDLEARVAGPSADLIGRLGEGFNGMADVIARRVKDREELLQAVAHEYGTPLARLSLEIELLAGRVGPDHAARIERLRGEVRELDALTGELTDWVSLEDDPLPTAFDLDDAITGEVERTDDARVSWVPLGESVDLVGDERLFRRAVGNLLRNACRYADTRVVVFREISDDAVTIVVDDDGPGIPAGDRVRVFEPFARLDASRDRARGGVGLGLAIVRRIAVQHGGAAWAEASLLGGASMRVRWPRASRTEAAAP